MQAEVEKEHAGYYAALAQHPRALVGRTVPSVTGTGDEVLRDANDAKEWQEAVTHLLAEEVKDRVGRKMEESRDFLATVHESISLFQQNPDLIPGTTGFDKELADRFASLVQPYELRVEGKLQGYSIPTQPIVAKIREQLVRERAATPAAPAASATAPPANAGAAAPAADAKPEDQPQAGIAGKAGGAPAGEDFSTLFATLGEQYRDLQI
jgi:hypothetical protein